MKIISLILLAAITSQKAEVQQIDKKIEHLTEVKRRYNAEAIQYREEADRWQFYPGRMQDARNA